MISCRAVGNGPLLFAGLELAGAVGGAGDERIVAAGGGMPLIGPEHPGILRERRLKLRVVPGDAIVGADLDLLDAAITGEGEASNLDSRLEGHAGTWTINACDS